MELGELKLLLPMEPEEVESLWKRFGADVDSVDLDHFLAWLYENRHVGNETFRALHGHGTLSLVTLDELLGEEEDEGFEARFKMLGVLGRGAMGEVHVAREKDLRRKVALKILLPELAGDSDIVKRFFREVQITAWLDHPNIVPVYAFDMDEDGSPACAMKLIQGRTLREYLDETQDQVDRGAIDDTHELTWRLEHFLRICDAIAFAHSKGIIHRDLKPSNVMIGPFGEVYVMDWGIARPLRFEEGIDAGAAAAFDAWSKAGLDSPRQTGGVFATQYGTVVGTPHYMSPEQACGETDLDGRSDMYALGLILRELITLEPAIEAETVNSALEAAAVGSVRRLQWPLPDGRVPPELAAITSKATELRPEDRYATVAELAEDLRRYLRGEAVLASPDTPVQALLRWVGSHRESTVLLLALGLVLVLGAVTWGLLRERAVQEEAQIREEALGSALTRVATRAGKIDREFLRYEGLLEGLAASAVQAIDSPDPGEAVYLLDDDFGDPDRAPDDLAWSDHYGKAISTAWPVHVLAPGVDRESVEPILRKLSAIDRRFPSLVVRSDPTVVDVPSSEQLRELVAGTGVPVVWAYVGLEEGIHTAWPGKAGYPADYDPRERPWYRLSAYKHGPRCGNPYLDSQGQGLLLPCAIALYDGAGEFRGVAGVDLTFDWIVHNLLELDVSGVRESFLLSDSGHVVVRSNYAKEAPEPSDDALRLPLFHHIGVVAAALEGRSGYLEIEEDGATTLVAWYRMNALGWFYAVEADSGAFLGALSE